MTVEATLTIIFCLIGMFILLFVLLKQPKSKIIQKETRKKYILVYWPESQVLMDYDWFDKEAVLADWVKCGSSSYFIPEHRLNEINKNN
jgi:hypothetical protein